MTSLIPRVLVTVRRPTPGSPRTRDKYGNVVITKPQHTVPDCVVEPRSYLGSENVAARDQVIRGLWLYCDDPDADLDEYDEVYWDGVWWQVDGQVGRYKAGTPVDHAEAALTRITG